MVLLKPYIYMRGMRNANRSNQLDNGQEKPHLFILGYAAQRDKFRVFKRNEIWIRKFLTNVNY